MSTGPVDLFSAASALRKAGAPAAPPRRGPFAPMRRRGGGREEQRPPPVEIAFLLDYGVAPQTLGEAHRIARRQGVSADAALLAERLIDEAFFYRALADHLGAAFVDGGVEVAPSGVATAASGYARLKAPERGVMWLFAPRGAEIVRLMSAVRAAGGRPRFAVTTRTRFIEAVRRADPEDVARIAAFSAERANKDLCVRGALRRGPLAVALIMLAALAFGLFSPMKPLALACAFFFAVAFLANIFLRLLAVAAGYEARDPSGWIADARAPIYTIVIALYQESSVARQLVRALDGFDYPRAKLDIKFVVEQDDAETAAALRADPPSAPYEIIVAPEGAPRTKPRALNIAMPLARGSLVAVFDAEDLPDPRQLRSAAALFDALPQDVACLQASLVIDNGGLNWMTALFALDYAALFDIYNKGLSALDLPLFLGGTSNHFRIDALREIGFWDAYNVTEDADLGLRLARAGYAVRTFASQTFEEAPATFRALLRQRTRWFKGWMQTALVHCRHPLKLIDDLGARRAGAVCAMFVGGILGPLLGPLFAARLASDAVFGALLRPSTTIDLLLSTLWCFLAVAGGVALVGPLALGMMRRRMERRWPALLSLPFWLLMLSAAAWRALYQLWRQPFHWEKTAHGLTARGEASAGDAPPAPGALSLPPRGL